MPALIPDDLRYMESVLQKLRALPPENVNEDIDASELETVLRERVAGLSIREAQARLSHDRKSLRAWFREAGDANGAGRWLIAFLGYRPGAMVRSLLAPRDSERPKAASRGTIVFEPPEGWTVELDDDSSISLYKDGQEVGSMGVVWTTSLAYYRRRHDAEWIRSAVEFGACHGDKYVYHHSGDAPFKTVRYVLEVPGGAIEACCGSNPGEGTFDETVFEARLSTLRVTPKG